MTSPTTTTRTTGEPVLRRDAAANREKVLAAAARIFGDRGLEASVDEIAREAGVGMGTVYRRFPHKQALIDELVGGVRRELGRSATEAVGHDADSPGTGLELLLRRTGEIQAGGSGCLAQLWRQSSAELEVLAEFRTVLAQLLVSAQAAGRVRPDVGPTDLSVAMWSLRGVIETTRDVAPDAWRRHLELLVAGLRPPAEGAFGGPLLETPLSDDLARQVGAVAQPASQAAYASKV